MESILAHNEVLNVLLIEDNPADIELTRETLEECKIAIELYAVDNGIDAMKFLFAQGNYKDVPKPDLILLDLNLPGKDGREILKEIKTAEELKHIPVVVLTTSEAGSDILKSYYLGANCFLTKPVGLNEFAKLVKTIENFWFTIVKLPTKIR